jgi:cystathionine gamma-lyase
VEGEPVYGRYGHPSRLHLEATLAAVEGAAHCLTFSSGMAAASAVLDSLLPGEEVVASRHLYGEVLTSIRGLAGRGVRSTFIDCSDPGAVGAAVGPATRLVWLELCTNPTLRLLDLPAVVAAVKARSSACRVLVDNTFLTPWVVRPLALGADIVLHSLTKYINGHSDVIMGSLATDRPELQQELEERQRHGGAAPSSFDCFLVHRSLATLHLRLERQMASGLAVARWLEARREVAAVLHPLLPSHPQHALARRQQAGRHSGMLSFHLRSGAAAGTFLRGLRIVRSAARCKPPESSKLPPKQVFRRAAVGFRSILCLEIG